MAQMAGDDAFLSAPAVPAPPGAAERVEPEVTIIETDEEVIYEYSVKGQVYMVKIEPVAGPPYYLLDTDGDGTLDVQESHEPNLALPQWLLFSW
jgi:DNA/RNA endonuclease YhcR with UshA esterase domain